MRGPRAPWHAFACALALVALALAPAPALAHTRRVAYVTVATGGEGAAVAVTLRAIDLTALEATGVEGAIAGGPGLEAYLPAALAVRKGATECAVTAGSFHRLPAPRGEARFAWQVSCPGAGALVLRSRLHERIVGHTTFARARDPDGGTSPERVLTDRAPEGILVVGPPAPFGEAFARHVGLGLEHILSGWDHLVFVLLLLLGARRFRDLATVVTGFTVGHSATLALAAAGFATPRAAAVEALIALSIVWLAVEVWLGGAPPAGERTRRALPVVAALSALPLAASGALPPLSAVGVALFGASWLALAARDPGGPARIAVALLFGLVHGFGFAGVLRQASLSGPELLPGLFGFNVGVELGQLAVVAVVFPLWATARRRASWRRGAVEVGTALGAALGAFWLVDRLLA